MIDNFEQIKNMLVFESEDDFYHLQILKRKKENPELGSNSYTIKTYYVTSVEYLESKKAEIINLCQFNNARACINLNPRSFESVAFHTLRKVTDIIMNKDFKSVRKAYESVCGTYGTGKNKSWIVDIDMQDMNVVNRIAKLIDMLQPVTDDSKVKAVLPTKNGYHLITSPFNAFEFNKYMSLQGDVPDLHKNNPTILYIA
jgi:hypothetical protein